MANKLRMLSLIPACHRGLCTIAIMTLLDPNNDQKKDNSNSMLADWSLLGSSSIIIVVTHRNL